MSQVHRHVYSKVKSTYDSADASWPRMFSTTVMKPESDEDAQTTVEHAQRAFDEFIKGILEPTR